MHGCLIDRDDGAMHGCLIDGDEEGSESHNTTPLSTESARAHPRSKKTCGTDHSLASGLRRSVSFEIMYEFTNQSAKLSLTWLNTYSPQGTAPQSHSDVHE
jgi:hypothetical protein